MFDLGALRPFNSAHLISMPNMGGVNSVQAYNVHTIAIQVPIKELVKGGVPKSPTDANATIGVWTSASRRVEGLRLPAGQVRRSRSLQAGLPARNPLVNEVLIPMAKKDQWNARPPRTDSRFAKYVDQPELAGLLPALYPGVFPKLKAYSKSRADLDAILLTGIPSGVVPGFQNFTGGTKADMLRLNVAVKPSKKENPIGLVAGDAAGFRRAPAR